MSFLFKGWSSGSMLVFGGVINSEIIWNHMMWITMIKLNSPVWGVGTCWSVALKGWETYGVWGEVESHPMESSRRVWNFMSPFNANKNTRLQKWWVCESWKPESKVIDQIQHRDTPSWEGKGCMGRKNDFLHPLVVNLPALWHDWHAFLPCSRSLFLGNLMCLLLADPDNGASWL